MNLIVPTTDPGATEKEYVARGWKVGDLYAAPFYPQLCNPTLIDPHVWALSFWKPDEPEQKELL